MTTNRGKRNAADHTWDRRTFIKSAGFAVLAVHCLPAPAFAAPCSQEDATQHGTDLTIKSGPGAFQHVHYLRIPDGVLTMPPDRGVQLTTTKAVLHRHRLTLSQAELRSVRDGGTVTQRASSHVFVIALANATTEASAQGL